MRKILIIVYFTVLSEVLSSCAYGINNFFGREDSVRTRAESLKQVDIPSALSASDGSYTVAVITDVHFGADKSRNVDNAFLSWLDGLYGTSDFPKFVLCLGDVAEHGYKNEMNDYNAFCDKIREYNIEVFSVLGNHDLYNSGWQYWKNIVRPETSFYHFKTNNFSWYFLDTGNGTLGSHQYSVLIDALESDSAPKVVCMHYPLYAQGHFYYCLQDSIERNLLIAYFADNNVKLVLVGHTHQYNYTDMGFIEYNVPGFLEKGQWALVKVDESAGTVTPELVSE
ncbi:MAG: metallophosphoesterase [Treponema sp.]|nr:metallophosphoesterase [Treponema sp.]